MAVVRSITCRYWHCAGRSTKTVIDHFPSAVGAVSSTDGRRLDQTHREKRPPSSSAPSNHSVGALPSSALAAALERQLRPTLRCPAHAHARHPDRLVHVAPRSLPSPRASSPHHLATHHARAAAERRHAWTDGSARRRCGRPSSRPVTPAAPPSLTHVHPLPMQRGPRPPQGASSHDMLTRYAQAPSPWHASAPSRPGAPVASPPPPPRARLGPRGKPGCTPWHGHVVAWPLSWRRSGLAPVVAWRRS